MTGGLEQLSCNERLREWGLLSLEKGRGTLATSISSERRDVKRMEPGSA